MIIVTIIRFFSSSKYLLECILFFDDVFIPTTGVRMCDVICKYQACGEAEQN